MDRIVELPVGLAARSLPRSQSRAARLRRCVMLGIVGVALFGSVGTGLLLAITPAVGDLTARVDAGLRTHRAEGLSCSPPARLSAAIVATEDSRFYSGIGLDPRGVLRAFRGLASASNQGGATLAQQLAKEIYTPADSPANVIEDVALALKIAATYSKRAIILDYLNVAYFGDGAWGANAAAEHYFGRSPTELSWAQASMLAGLVQAPSAYDPHGHLALAKSRQQHVLARLVAVGALTTAESHVAYAGELHPAVTFYG